MLIYTSTLCDYFGEFIRKAVRNCVPNSSRLLPILQNSTLTLNNCSNMQNLFVNRLYKPYYSHSSSIKEAVLKSFLESCKVNMMLSTVQRFQRAIATQKFFVVILLVLALVWLFLRVPSNYCELYPFDSSLSDRRLPHSIWIYIPAFRVVLQVSSGIRQFLQSNRVQKGFIYRIEKTVQDADL